MTGGPSEEMYPQVPPVEIVRSVLGFRRLLVSDWQLAEKPRAMSITSICQLSLLAKWLVRVGLKEQTAVKAFRLLSPDRRINSLAATPKQRKNSAHEKTRCWQANNGSFF